MMVGSAWQSCGYTLEVTLSTKQEYASLFFFFFAGVELTISRQQKKFQHLLPLYCVLGIPRPGHVDLSRGGHLGKLGQRGPQVGFSNLDSAVVPNCCRWLRLKL